MIEPFATMAELIRAQEILTGSPCLGPCQWCGDFTDRFIMSDRKIWRACQRVYYPPVDDPWPLYYGDKLIMHLPRLRPPPPRDFNDTCAARLLRSNYGTEPVPGWECRR